MRIVQGDMLPLGFAHREKMLIATMRTPDCNAVQLLIRKEIVS